MAQECTFFNTLFHSVQLIPLAVFYSPCTYKARASCPQNVYCKGSKNGCFGVWFFFYEYMPHISDTVKCVWHGRIYGNVMDLNTICKYPDRVNIVYNNHFI